ncbi:MAG: hypothetical protein WBZ36_00755 [Candidatus Nitrosopolaris sp.]
MRPIILPLTEDGKHALKFLGGDPGDSVKKVLLDIFLGSQYHFDAMVVANTYDQLQLLLQVIETLQYTAEIPRELLEKMFRITHLAGVRCMIAVNILLSASHNSH